MQREPSFSIAPSAEETVASDFYARLRRHRGPVLGIVAAFLALGFVYTTVVPPRWNAASTILMPGNRATGAAAAAAQLGLNVGSGGETSLSMFHKILDSERVLNIVSKQTGYPVKELRKNRRTDEDTKNNSLTVSVVDRNPKKALQVDRALLTALGSVVNDLMFPSRNRRTDVLEQSLSKQTRALSAAEDRLEKFSRNALTAPISLGTVTSGSGPSAAAIPTVAPPFRYQDQVTTLQTQLQSLDAQLSAGQQKSQKAGADTVPDFPPVEVWQKQLAEIEGRLSAARAAYREDSPEVMRIKKEYDNVRVLEQRDIDRYLGAVESRVAGTSAKLDQDRQGVLSQIAAIRKLAAAAPREATEYQRLARDVAQLTSLVTQLRLQYEQSRLDSLDDPNRWVILDQPAIDEDPVNKNFARNMGLAGVLGFLLAIPVANRLDSRRLRRENS